MADGFLYAATGEKWLAEAERSAAQLRRIHPEASIVLFTDRNDVPVGAVFDDVIVVPERNWIRTEVKLWAVARSPFERTVYLDTDTHVCGRLSELFAIVDRFDFAGVPVPMRSYSQPNHADPADIPEAFQAVNGGVFAWRTNAASSALFESWWQLYQADRLTAGDDDIMDQPSLRVALWRSPCQIVFLAPEYNMRVLSYRVRPTTAVGPVRIIHGRTRSLPDLERKWNAHLEPRLLTPIAQYHARTILKSVVRGRALGRLKAATVGLRRRLAG